MHMPQYTTPEEGLMSNMHDYRGWARISCVERDEHYEIAGAHLKPWSSLTDPDGAYGSPVVFTEWGRDDQDEPLLRDYRYPGADRFCEHWFYIGRGGAPQYTSKEKLWRRSTKRAN